MQIVKGFGTYFVIGTHWEASSKAFLVRFFSPAKIAKQRNVIFSFHQEDGEALYKAWERYKGMQRKFPHHGIPNWLVIHNFYIGIREEIQISIDAAAGGTLMAKTLELAKQIIEEMSLNFYWRDKRNNKKGGKYEVDALLAIQNYIPALARRMDQLSAGNTLKACQVCRIQGHSSSECVAVESSSSQQVNAVYNQGKPPFNPYSKTYNEGWKHYPNFS